MLRWPAVSVLWICVCACGDPRGLPPIAEEEDAELSALAVSAPSAWLNALPENTSDVIERETISFHLCTFTIGTALQAPPFPPVYLVWLRRDRASVRHDCPSGYVVLDSSYAPPFVDVARHPVLPLIVATFSTKQTPSGSAHTQLRVVQPSYVTGNTLRTSTLAAMSPPGMPWLGNVYTGTLSALLDGTVRVTGTKDGLMTPAEAPPGTLGYRAKYAHFFFSPSAQPVPTTLETF